MNIIAKRDKVMGKFLFIGGIILVALSFSLLSISLWYILSIVLGLSIFAIGLYSGILLPKTAIAIENDTLIIYYAFCKKRIPLSKIDYLNYNELGLWHTRRGGLRTFYIFKNDIRTLTITTKENLCLKHYYIWAVLHTSATATIINSFIDKSKINSNISI